GEQKLQRSKLFTANEFANAVLLNEGNLNFSIHYLPWEAQLSCYRDAEIVNVNNDSLPDILLVGNFYDDNVRLGRYDADYGTILVNNGKGKFTVATLRNMNLKGQVRHIKEISVDNKQSFVF